MPKLRSIVFLAMLGVLSVQAAGAQGKSERDDEEKKDQCKKAARIVEKGHPEKQEEWALVYIANCDESGGPALATAWSTLPADSASAEALYLASARLKDARVYDAVRGVASNRAAPSTTRVYAVLVLARYARPQSEPELADMKPPFDVRKGFRLPPSTDHFTQFIGSSPLPASYQSDIRAFVQQLASETDPGVRAAAAYLSRLVLLPPG
jgi:hypothetical protein